MPKSLCCLISIFLFNFLNAQNNQPALKSIVDSTISLTKELSLYTNSVDWKLLEKDMNRDAANAETLDDLSSTFEILLNTLKDHHGTIRRSSNYSIFSSFTDFNNSRNTDTRVRPQEIWNVVNNPELRFNYKILAGQIGYLKIVGVGPNVDGLSEAKRIRQAIKDIHSRKINNWIIDLRYNGGGNINVMMSGLAPLFDTQIVARILGNENLEQGTAEIRNGEFWYYDANAFPVNIPVKLNNPKIAILTSRWTVSSGELVAVAFKKQANTRFFGEATGGYTTNNCWNFINDDLILSISTGIYADRNGESYPQNVTPDHELLFEVIENPSEDIGILKAIEWLKS